MKLVVTKQHFDVKPGTVLTYLNPSDCDTNLYGEPYVLTKHPVGFLFVIPNSKVLPEENSPYDTINS